MSALEQRIPPIRELPTLLRLQARLPHATHCGTRQAYCCGSFASCPMLCGCSQGRLACVWRAPLVVDRCGLCGFLACMRSHTVGREVGKIFGQASFQVPALVSLQRMDSAIYGSSLVAAQAMRCRACDPSRGTLPWAAGSPCSGRPRWGRRGMSRPTCLSETPYRCAGSCTWAPRSRCTAAARLGRSARCPRARGRFRRSAAAAWCTDMSAGIWAPSIGISCGAAQSSDERRIPFRVAMSSAAAAAAHRRALDLVAFLGEQANRGSQHVLSSPHDMSRPCGDIQPECRLSGRFENKILPGGHPCPNSIQMALRVCGSDGEPFQTSQGIISGPF